MLLCLQGLAFNSCFVELGRSVNARLKHQTREISFGRSQQIDVLNSLTQFKQLTELYFHNKHDMNLTPFHIQNMCPHLKQLKFVSDYSVPESMILDPSSNNIKIDLKFITSLRHLELHLPSLSAAYTRYLVD
ncbi:hypothetical protein MFLAVUS_004718 [Mucor flavus]|uniref:Uncharacterized protein n=1 Tax=Mucor flavus TaxID=439312 RepID=A0ABP9YWP9_9FUNG